MNPRDVSSASSLFPSAHPALGLVHCWASFPSGHQMSHPGQSSSCLPDEIRCPDRLSGDTLYFPLIVVSKFKINSLHAYHSELLEGRSWAVSPHLEGAQYSWMLTEWIVKWMVFLMPVEFLVFHQYLVGGSFPRLSWQLFSFLWVPIVSWML